MEIWKKIDRFDYYISSYGRVKNKDGKILRPDVNSLGYARVTLYSEDYKKREFIHRLVAKYFITNPLNKPNIDHIDTNPKNNYVENLRWCTQKENINNPISLNKRHKPHSKQWCDNIRKGHEKNPILCIELNVVFNSESEAERNLGVFQANISKVLKGKRKTAGGFHWKYMKGKKKCGF